MKLRKLDQKGQSTMEFAMAVGLMMGFLLFFIQLSIMFAYGNVVHYATFMSARAYLAASAFPQEQGERAKNMIVRLLKAGGSGSIEKYPYVRGSVDDDPRQGTGDGESYDFEGVKGLRVGAHSRWDSQLPSLSWMLGVRYRFKARLASVPLLSSRGDANSVTLTSESWLGREKSRLECEAHLKAINGGELKYDNGC